MERQRPGVVLPLDRSKADGGAHQLWRNVRTGHRRAAVRRTALDLVRAVRRRARRTLSHERCQRRRRAGVPADGRPQLAGPVSLTYVVLRAEDAASMFTNPDYGARGG